MAVKRLNLGGRPMSEEEEGEGGGAREEVVVDHPGGCHGYFLPTSEGFRRHISGKFEGGKRPGIIRMKRVEIISSGIQALA